MIPWTTLSRGGGDLLRSEFEAIIDKVDRGKLEGKLESFTKFEGNRHSTPHPLLSRSFVTRGHRQPSINILWEHRGGGGEFSTSHQYLIWLCIGCAPLYVLTVVYPITLSNRLMARKYRVYQPPSNTIHRGDSIKGNCASKMDAERESVDK